MRIYINAEDENAKLELEDIFARICLLHGFQRARFHVVGVCPSSVDCFNVLGSPMSNQIGVQSNRKVHRGLSLMYYNR